jgi:hypothetical protein
MSASLLDARFALVSVTVATVLLASASFIILPVVSSTPVELALIVKRRTTSSAN